MFSLPGPLRAAHSTGRARRAFPHRGNTDWAEHSHRGQESSSFVPQRGSRGLRDRGLTSTESLKTQEGFSGRRGASTLPHSHRVQLASASTSDQNSPSPRAAGQLVSDGNDVSVVLTESNLDCSSPPLPSPPLRKIPLHPSPQQTLRPWPQWALDPNQPLQGLQ